MTRWIPFVLSIALSAPFAFAADAAKADEKPRVDIVFCIDCSGSMGPVIETAKQKVWAIVNQVAKAKPTPALRIGLLGYGNSDRTFREFPLSDDLDEVYKHLVTFKDEGWGTEWVGLAVKKATNEMKWADGKETLKIIYVVGNETAHQGPAELDYTKTAPAAIAKGIIVNAVYCGNVEPQAGPPTWREMAKLADGKYLEIGADGGVIAIATPFDDELAKLSAQLNTTYCAYGPAGAAGAGNQVAQDGNAAGLGKSVAAERAMSKASSSLYSNGRWDLVDRAKDKDFKLEDIKEADLPDEMKKLKPAERKAYLDEKAAERAKCQEQIKAIGAKREAFLKEELAKKGLSGDKAFDHAVRESLKEQAEKKGYRFSE